MQDDLDPLTKPDPDDLPQQLQRAAELSDEGRWVEAFQLLLELEPAHPRDPMLLCMLAVAAEESNAETLVYDFLRRCIAEQPSDPEVLVTAGSMLARYDDPDAESTLRLAAVSSPDSLPARLYYGAFLAREGLADAALEELRAAERLDPDDARVHRELGVALTLRGDLREGADALERAVGLDAEDAELRLLYGLALHGAGDAEPAAEELHRAAADLLDDGEAQLVAALASAGQDWMDEAWEGLARAEAAEMPPSSTLVREAEDALAAGPDAARRLLDEHLAPSALRLRLLAPPG